MSGNDARGWGSILGEVEQPTPDERTDPNIDVNQLRFDEKTELAAKPQPDPVTAAMVELDGPAVAPPRPGKSAAPSRSASFGKGLAIPKPSAAPPEPKAQKSKSLPPHAKAPAPTASPQKPRLTLPTPSGPPSGGGGVPMASAMGESDVAPGFSTAEMVEKLGEPIDGPDAAPSVKGAKKSSGVWAEYKEVIVSAIVGALLLIGVIVYQRVGKKEPPLPVELMPPPAPSALPPSIAPGLPPPLAPPPLAPPPMAPPSGVGLMPAISRDPSAPPPIAPSPIDTNPITRGEPPSTPGYVAPPPASERSAAIPMVSILSVPSGAEVEIDGQVMGKTPFIRPGSKGRMPLRVVVRHPDYKPWEQLVRPNDVGHYNASAKLEPRKK